MTPPLLANFQSAVRANGGVDPFARLRRKRRQMAEERLRAIQQIEQSRRTAAGIPPQRGI